MLKKPLAAGCSKTLRYKGPEIPACGRQAEEWDVQSSTSQGRGMRDEGNEVNERFSATC